MFRRSGSSQGADRPGRSVPHLQSLEKAVFREDESSSREPRHSGHTKRKGLQLALEPLNGQGIAGYVPEPEFWGTGS